MGIYWKVIQKDCLTSFMWRVLGKRGAHHSSRCTALKSIFLVSKVGFHFSLFQWWTTLTVYLLFVCTCLYIVFTVYFLFFWYDSWHFCPLPLDCFILNFSMSEDLLESLFNMKYSFYAQFLHKTPHSLLNFLIAGLFFLST